MNEVSSLWVIGDDHKGLSGVKLLAELNDAVQVVVEQLLILQVQFAFTKGLLVAFVHVEDDLLVGVGALKEVGNVTLLLNELD